MRFRIITQKMQKKQTHFTPVLKLKFNCSLNIELITR